MTPLFSLIFTLFIDIVMIIDHILCDLSDWYSYCQHVSDIDKHENSDPSVLVTNPFLAKRLYY